MKFIMKYLSQCKLYLTNERRIIADNKEVILKLNQNIFKVLMYCGIFILFSLFTLSYFVDSYSNMRYCYICSCLLVVLAIHVESHISDDTRIVWYYIYYAIFALFAAHTSALVTPNYVGIMILIFLFGMPIIILDHSVRIVTFQLFILILYLYIVIPNKEARLVPDEIVNTLVFTFLGCIAGSYIRSVRLNNMDLVRRLNLERTTDVLTGLANRRMLFEYFVKQENSINSKNPYAVAIIDIDDFKKYNDTYGHLAGDKCLGKVGKCFRIFGINHGIDFYRYGGEEFVAVVRKEPVINLTDLFTELNHSIVNLHIPHKNMQGGYVTISIGIRKIEEVNQIINYELMIEDADKALYQVKKSQKGKSLEYKE